MSDSTYNQQKLKDLKSLSVVMDSKYIGPFGIRFGLDGILGFVPVIGDLITASMSFYIIAQAAFLGCSTATILRMALNVAIENLFDLVPFIGNFFDIFWKANNKNIILLEQHLVNPKAVTLQSKLLLIALGFFLIILLIATGYLSYLLMQYIYQSLTSN